MDIQLSGLSGWAWYGAYSGTYTHTLYAYSDDHIDSLVKSSLIYTPATQENTLNIFAKCVVIRDSMRDTNPVETNNTQKGQEDVRTLHSIYKAG